jgi:beta-lactamase class A
LLLDEILESPKLQGTSWSVQLRLPGGAVYGWRPLKLLRTASVAKLFLLVEVATSLEEGSIDAGLLVDRRSVAPVGDSGIWQYLKSEILPIEDVALLVGSVSDNWATNVLLDVVGNAALGARPEKLARNGSALHDIVRDKRGPSHAPTLSLGCGEDWAVFMENLGHLAVVSPRVSRRVLSWIGPSSDLSMVASVFNLDPLAHTGPNHDVSIWCKTGTDDGVRADVGHVVGPKGRASYAVICNWEPESADKREVALATLRQIGMIVREAIAA